MMHADISRATFQPANGYAAVVVQQGRVQLDADANEQAAISLHLARTLAADVIGQHGGPGDGFRIEYRAATDDEPADLVIAGGRYYVDGVMVDASRPVPRIPTPRDPRAGTKGAGDEPAGSDDDAAAAGTAPRQWTYWDQPHAYRDPELESDELPEQLPFLVYLKVWDQLVTAVEDPAIRETALGSALPDTTARLRAAWQVLPLRLEGEDPVAAFEEWVSERTAERGFLAARTERPDRIEDDPCILAPDARYRGPENQLYRVEVHQGGPAGRATFVWSRDNGSVVFAIDSIDGAEVTLAALGRDDKLDLHVGDWVEVVDDAYAARDEPAPLLQVQEVDVPARLVRLSDEPGPRVGRLSDRHPRLRRWDHRAPSGRGGPRLDGGAVKLTEGQWLDLEDGVQVWFRRGGTYRSGDHWLIPARTVTGDVEWPRSADGRPLLAPPAGVRVHYAPLAWVRGPGDVQHLRRTFQQLPDRT